MKSNNAMTNRRNFSSVQNISPVDGLLMDRLSVIARNRGMGGRRLGPIQVPFTRRKFRTVFQRERKFIYNLRERAQKSSLHSKCCVKRIISEKMVESLTIDKKGSGESHFSGVLKWQNEIQNSIGGFELI